MERLDAYVVAGAEQQMPARVPDHEREVAEQMLRAGFAPAGVRAKDEIRVAEVGGAGEVGGREQLGAVVESSVGGDVHTVATRTVGAEADVPVAPYVGGIQPAMRQARNHAIEGAMLHGPAVEIEQSGDGTHGVSFSNGGRGANRETSGPPRSTLPSCSSQAWASNPRAPVRAMPMRTRGV